ncbi:predicted protein [Postia placenta Mad-698-R]|nr:predicted protein [Postia placenta Mad-698-R]
MSSVTIDVPPGTSHIVLKFQSEEAEQLRRRLRAAEEWSKDCNSSLSAEVARPTRESANAQTLIQQWEGSFTQTSQLPQNEVEMKPTRMKSKKGNWREAQDNKLTGSHNEVSAVIPAMRCYLGNYERVSAVAMTKEEFDSLPTQVREGVMKASSDPKHQSETRNLYKTGQILPRKINFRRALLDAGHVCGLLFGTPLNQHEVQKCSPWIVPNIQNGELGRRTVGKASNEKLTAEIARIRTQLESVSALDSGLQPVQTTGGLCPSANPQDGPVDDAQITFCLERNPKEYLKAAKVLRDDVAWGELPSSGFLVRPTRIRTKKGRWNKVQNKKLLRDRMEFVAYNGFEWKYLGTFTSANTDSEELSREAFFPIRRLLKPRIAMIRSPRSEDYAETYCSMEEGKGGKTLECEIGYSVIFFFREIVELKIFDRGHNLDEEAAKDIAQKQLDYERRVHQEYSDYPESDTTQFACGPRDTERLDFVLKRRVLCSALQDSPREETELDSS